MTAIAIDRVDPTYKDIADLLSAGRFEESAAALQHALETDGRCPDLLRLLGYQLEGMCRFDQAYATYKQLAATAKPDAHLYARLARCCLLLGRPYEAGALRKLIGNAPDCESLERCIAAAILTWKRKWADARAALDGASVELDADWRDDAQCRRQLCENMLHLQEYQRPAFDALAGARPPLHVCKVVDRSGVIAVAHLREGRWAPILSLPSQVPQIPEDKRGCLQAFSLAFGSLTIWPLIRQCFHERPANLYLTQEQSFHIFESDPQVFYALAMIEDLRPYIITHRIHWYLGPDCDKAFRRGIEDDRQLAIPVVTIGTHPGVQQTIDALTVSRKEEKERLTAELQAYYRALPPDHGRRVFSDALGRRPRVYLLTTRFSTVLRFVTADMERAFHRLGWETRVGIEADDAKIYSEYTITRDLGDFRPDVVFMLDHLRYEWLFRDFPELYHVCWIQDQMPNLYCPEAGASVGERDFVLVLGSGADLMHRYHYPRRCLIHMPFSANLDAQVNTDSADLSGYVIPDVTFASNHGRTPEDTLPLVLDGLGEAPPPEVLRLLGPYLHAVLDAYAADNVLYEDLQYRRLLESTEARSGLRLPDEHWRIMLARVFRLHVGACVHRQQVLRWLRDGDVRFGVYGRDWERHPEFAPYARGVIVDGNIMNAIFRAAPINLQISQYTNSHIRFWNGLAAGGFFLVRACPADSGRSAAERVLGFLRSHMGRSYRDVEPAGRLTAWEEVLFRSHFEETIPGHDRIDEYAVDVFLMTLESPTWAEKVGPLAEKIQFGTRDQCIEMIRRYLRDAAARADVLAEARGVLENQTYEANLRRALATIRDRIG